MRLGMSTQEQTARGVDMPARPGNSRGVTLSTFQSQSGIFVPDNCSYKYTTEAATIIPQLPNGYPLDPGPIPFHQAP